MKQKYLSFVDLERVQVPHKVYAMVKFWGSINFDEIPILEFTYYHP